jgi:hypothetical protein
MARGSTKPFGVGAGPGQKAVSSIVGQTGSTARSASNGTKPFGMDNRGSGGNFRGSQPSGVANSPQRGSGTKNGPDPSYMAPNIPMRTTGHHTPLEGLSPTSSPGQTGPSFPVTGKMMARGGKTTLPPKGTTAPNAAPRMPIRTSGPSGKR